MQCTQPLVRSDAGYPRILFYGSVDLAVFVSGAVVIAKGDQWPDFQPQILRRFRMIIFLEFVLHHGAVLTVDHENSFLDLDALDFVGEDRKRIEAKLLQVAKALWVNNAGILVCREIERLSVDEKRLFHLSEQD